mmetsp:Transcript_50032/g.82311  ORF Transcript_50032/g.82311 Transcript_50032/m.82311 type:complete len:295 (+) Transcript_50032:64-948(+)
MRVWPNVFRMIDGVSCPVHRSTIWQVPDVVDKQSTGERCAWSMRVGSNCLWMIDAVARFVHGCAIWQVANIVAEGQARIGILLHSIREAGGMTQLLARCSLWGGGSHEGRGHRGGHGSGRGHGGDLGLASRRGSGAGVGNGGVVQADAHLSIFALPVAKGVLHFADGSIRTAAEVVVAHGNGNVAVQVDLMVVEHHIGPTLATVDGEAMILRNSFTSSHSIGPHEVGQGLDRLGTELHVLRLGGLEEDISMAIAIEFTGIFQGQCHIVSAFQVDLGNALDGFHPSSLGVLHLFQ